MEFLDKIIIEFENENERLEERITSGIAYDFKKSKQQWEDERNFLKALLIHIKKVNNS